MRLRKIEEHITVTTFVHNSASEVAKFSKPAKETREKRFVVTFFWRSVKSMAQFQNSMRRQTENVVKPQLRRSKHETALEQPDDKCGEKIAVID